MSKDEVKALIDSQVQILKDAIDSIPEAPVSDLQAQLDAALAANTELQKKSDDAVASLSVEIAKEADLQAQKDASDAKIAKAISDLQGA